MNLEHHRKEAKRLLRAFQAGAPEALARAERAIGDRSRFQLSDAQHVIAVEAGYRTWPELRRAAEAPGSRDDARSETVVDVGLEYGPGEPVLVRVVRRGERGTGIAEWVTDDGAAVAKAGRPPAWRDAVDRVHREFIVNISRRGVVSLPVVSVGPTEEEVVRRIGQASLALYQEILDLEG